MDFTDVAMRRFSQERAKRFHLKAGDILVERSGGGPSQPVGRIVVLDRDLENFGFSNFVQMLRVNEEVMLPDYVAGCLFLLHRSGIVERLQYQTTQMRNLDFRTYLRIKLPKPPIDEQKAIASAIASADFAVQSARAEFEAASDANKSLMSDLFINGIPGRHLEWKSASSLRHRFQIPASWQYIRLGGLVAQVDYGTNAPSNQNGFGLPVIAIPQVIEPVLRSGDWPRAEISAREAEQLRLNAGDVLVIRTNGNPEYIGKSTVISAGIAADHVIFASYLIRLRTNRDLLRGEYLNALLRSPLGRRQSLAMANTSAGNHNLGARSLKRFMVPLPPVDEQDEIVKILETARGASDAFRFKKEALEATHQSLLRSLIMGTMNLENIVTA